VTRNEKNPEKKPSFGNLVGTARSRPGGKGRAWGKKKIRVRKLKGGKLSAKGPTPEGPKYEGRAWFITASTPRAEEGGKKGGWEKTPGFLKVPEKNEGRGPGNRGGLKTLDPREEKKKGGGCTGESSLRKGKKKKRRAGGKIRLRRGQRVKKGKHSRVG